MSHAPTLRKSAQAQANARQRRERLAPHQVVLRVKRKRSDVAVESLLVAGTDEEERDSGLLARKRRLGPGKIVESLADLSLNQNNNEHTAPGGSRVEVPQRLIFKRVRTTDPDGSRRKAAAKGEQVGVAGPEQTTPPTSLNAGSKAVGGREGEGGRLDALLDEVNTSTPDTPSTSRCNIMDYLEVRRMKAKGVAAVKNSAVVKPLGDGDNDGSRLTSASTVSGSSAADLHVIDLQPIAKNVDKNANGSSAPDCAARSGRQVQGAVPVLNPVERQMDEGIFKAFQTGDMSNIRKVVASSPSAANYRRRLGDGTSALMAAAFHDDLATIRHLLSVGAKASLVDAGGKSASLIAGMRGHRECFAELQRAADEENERSFVVRGQMRSGGVQGKYGCSSEFVYDLYCFETSAPGEGRDKQATAGGAQGGTKQGSAGMSDTSGGDEQISSEPMTGLPVVRLSGIGPVDATVVGAAGVAELELEFEHDSDWSALGDGENGEDPDSNSEGYYGNDYPEDEENDAEKGASYIYGGSSCESDNGSSSAGALSSDDYQEKDHRRTLKSVYGNIGQNSNRSGGATPQGFSFAADVEGRQMGGSLLTPTSGWRVRGAAGMFAGRAFENAGYGTGEVFAWDPVRASAPDQHDFVQTQSHGSDDMDGCDSGSDGLCDDGLQAVHRRAQI